jgi:hypothetical protein
MTIPTAPIGRIARPPELTAAFAKIAARALLQEAA